MHDIYLWLCCAEWWTRFLLVFHVWINEIFEKKFLKGWKNFLLFQTNPFFSRFSELTMSKNIFITLVPFITNNFGAEFSKQIFCEGHHTSLQCMAKNKRFIMLISRRTWRIFSIMKVEQDSREKTKTKKVLSLMEHRKMYAQIRKRKVSCLSD